MEIRTFAEYQAGLLEVKRLITEVPADSASIGELAGALDEYEIRAGHAPVRPDDEEAV